ncbi:acylphosphatase [Burkholderiales bacterium]|nr:acylphosphatase [Burkholderiales bacterium]
MIARRLRVHGRVQGVGFRAAMADAALASGVDGWVRNRRDGTVEAWLQGPDDAVARVVAWARRGPPLARVDRIDVDESDADAAVRGFGQAPTA